MDRGAKGQLSLKPAQMMAPLSPDLGDNLSSTAFGCKLAVWESGWMLPRSGGGNKLELCRQDWRLGFLGSRPALLNDDDNGSLWECIEVYLSTFAERFGILEQGAMWLMINGPLHTWLWWQANSCSAVLEINPNILLI